MSIHSKIDLTLTRELLRAVDREANQVQRAMGGFDRPNRSLAVRRLIQAGMKTVGEGGNSNNEGWLRGDDKHPKIKVTLPVTMLESIDVKARKLADRDVRGRKPNRSWAVRVLIQSGLENKKTNSKTTS